ncbi:major facilitator superfamily permease, partial [mine drainage metagenome]
DPARFGLANALSAMRVAFVDVALWWGLFTLPVLFTRRAHLPHSAGFAKIVRSGWQQFRSTFREVRKLRYVSAFLLSYWCYIDGVNTIIKMAVSYGLTLGFPSSSLIVAILLTQAVAFPAALVYAHLGVRWGVVRALYLGIGIYMVATVAAAFMTNVA